MLDTSSFTPERLKSLEDLPNEKWEYIKEFRNIYMVSNYGRIKANDRKSVSGRMLKPMIMAQGVISSNNQLATKLRLDGKQKTVTIRPLVKKYFPTKESIREQEIKQKKKEEPKKKDMQWGKYRTYNKYSKQSQYYRDREAMSKATGIPIDIINKVIEGQLPDILGMKIYVTERGGKDYCGKIKQSKE